MKNILTTKVIILIAITVLAIFMLIMMFFVMSTYKTLKVTAGEGGRVYGSGDYRKGQTVTVNAEVDDGYRFDGWYEWKTIQGDKKSSNAKYVFYMPSYSWHLYAKFVEITAYNNLYTEQELYLDFETAPQSHDLETKPRVREGDEVNLSANAVSGYTFVGWYKGGRLVSNAQNISFKMPSSELRLTARYVQGSVELYELKVVAEAGGNIDPQPRIDGLSVSGYYYPAGVTVILIAEATTGYEFDCWQWGGSTSENAQLAFVTQNANVTVTAKFRPIPHIDE